MIDTLGHPIKVGDIVLTSPYYSTLMTLVTKVVKVNKTTVSVMVAVPYYDYKSHKVVYGEKLMKRPSNKIICVNAQIKHNQKKFPEYAL